MKTFPPRIAAFATLALLVAATKLFAAGTLKPDHSLLDGILKDHVNNGWVNYKAMKSDDRVKQYIDYIKAIDTASIDPKERLAFWINAYNAWTLKIALDNYPLKNFKELGAALVIGTIFKSTIWDKDLVTMNGKTVMTLNEIENDIIREYRDARIHFSIVCAAKSCPPLRSEAYTGDKLSEQLDEQTRMFLSDTKKNQFDFEKKELKLSNIFNWFEGDFKKDLSFGKQKGTVIKFIARYVPKETADKLLAQEKDLDIDHLEYDWSLNGE
jgi:hypothetical protein